MEEKPYRSLNEYYRSIFGRKAAKISLDGGFTCPNRDGTCGTRGCLFCSAGGSGDFAENAALSITEQIAKGKAQTAGKWKNPAYIAYFQAFTNTYAPVEKLRQKYEEALTCPEIEGISIATRADCLPADVLALLAELNKKTNLWVELGLQTADAQSAAFIRRGYPLSTFTDALSRLRARRLDTIVHVILGLPGENREKMLETVRYLAKQDIQGIKLHVLKGTDLATVYEQHPFPVMTMEEYLDLVIDCVSLLPPELVIHRITGDGPKALLIAPLWSANKRLVLNSLTRRFKERGVTQGCGLTIPSSPTETPKEIPSKY